MRSTLFLILALFTSGCATISPVDALFLGMSEKPTAQETEWDINPRDKAEMATFWDLHKQCTDFAFKARVAGSPYSEVEIHTECLKRKGYKVRFKTAANSR